MTDTPAAATRGVVRPATFLRVSFVNNSCSRRDGGLLIKNHAVFMENVTFTGHKVCRHQGI